LAVVLSHMAQDNFAFRFYLYGMAFISKSS
jgi:hypothetical protein